MNFFRTIYLFVEFYFVFSLSACAYAGYYGFNVDCSINEKDFYALKAIGAKAIRLSFPKQSFFISQNNPDLNENTFVLLKQKLNLARKYEIKVVIDPHVFPGMSGFFSTRPDDILWTRPDLQNAIVKLWGEITRRFVDYNDVIIGFDLINEPAPPKSNELIDNRMDFIYDLYCRIINEIRKYDNKTAVIVEFPVALNLFGKTTSQTKKEVVSGFKLIDDKNIIYSFHMYEPGRFTHQGVLPDFDIGYSLYRENNITNKLKEYVNEIRKFQLNNNVRIVVGEFGVSRYAGKEGEYYIRDLINIFDEYSWGWFYHSFREAHVWDPEMSVTDIDDRTRRINSDKMKIFIKKFNELNEL